MIRPRRTLRRRYKTGISRREPGDVRTAHELCMKALNRRSGETSTPAGSTLASTTAPIRLFSAFFLLSPAQFPLIPHGPPAAQTTRRASVSNSVKSTFRPVNGELGAEQVLCCGWSDVRRSPDDSRPSHQGTKSCGLTRNAGLWDSIRHALVSSLASGGRESPDSSNIRRLTPPARQM